MSFTIITPSLSAPLLYPETTAEDPSLLAIHTPPSTISSDLLSEEVFKRAIDFFNTEWEILDLEGNVCCKLTLKEFLTTNIGAITSFKIVGSSVLHYFLNFSHDTPLPPFDIDLRVQFEEKQDIYRLAPIFESVVKRKFLHNKKAAIAGDGTPFSLLSFKIRHKDQVFKIDLTACASPLPPLIESVNIEMHPAVTLQGNQSLEQAKRQYQERTFSIASNSTINEAGIGTLIWKFSQGLLCETPEIFASILAQKNPETLKEALKKVFEIRHMDPGLYPNFIWNTTLLLERYRWPYNVDHFFKECCDISRSEYKTSLINYFFFSNKESWIKRRDFLEILHPKMHVWIPIPLPLEREVSLEKFQKSPAFLDFCIATRSFHEEDLYMVYLALGLAIKKNDKQRFDRIMAWTQQSSRPFFVPFSLQFSTWIKAGLNNPSFSLTLQKMLVSHFSLIEQALSSLSDEEFLIQFSEATKGRHPLKKLFLQSASSRSALLEKLTTPFLACLQEITRKYLPYTHLRKEIGKLFFAIPEEKRKALIDDIYPLLNSQDRKLIKLHTPVKQRPSKHLEKFQSFKSITASLDLLKKDKTPEALEAIKDFISQVNVSEKALRDLLFYSTDAWLNHMDLVWQMINRPYFNNEIKLRIFLDFLRQATLRNTKSAAQILEPILKEVIELHIKCGKLAPLLAITDDLSLIEEVFIENWNKPGKTLQDMKFYTFLLEKIPSITEKEAFVRRLWDETTQIYENTLAFINDISSISPSDLLSFLHKLSDSKQRALFLSYFTEKYLSKLVYHEQANFAEKTEEVFALVPDENSQSCWVLKLCYFGVPPSIFAKALEKKDIELLLTLLPHISINQNSLENIKKAYSYIFDHGSYDARKNAVRIFLNSENILHEDLTLWEKAAQHQEFFALFLLKIKEGFPLPKNIIPFLSDLSLERIKNQRNNGKLKEVSALVENMLTLSFPFTSIIPWLNEISKKGNSIPKDLSEKIISFCLNYRNPLSEEEKTSFFCMMGRIFSANHLFDFFEKNKNLEDVIQFFIYYKGSWQSSLRKIYGVISEYRIFYDVIMSREIISISSPDFADAWNEIFLTGLSCIPTNQLADPMKLSEYYSYKTRLINTLILSKKDCLEEIQFLISEMEQSFKIEFEGEEGFYLKTIMLETHYYLYEFLFKIKEYNEDSESINKIKWKCFFNFFYLLERVLKDDSMQLEKNKNFLSRIASSKRLSSLLFNNEGGISLEDEPKFFDFYKHKIGTILFELEKITNNQDYFSLTVQTRLFFNYDENNGNGLFFLNKEKYEKEFCIFILKILDIEINELFTSDNQRKLITSIAFLALKNVRLIAKLFDPLEDPILIFSENTDRIQHVRLSLAKKKEYLIIFLKSFFSINFEKLILTNKDFASYLRCVFKKLPTLFHVTYAEIWTEVFPSIFYSFFMLNGKFNLNIFSPLDIEKLLDLYLCILQSDKKEGFKKFFKNNSLHAKILDELYLNFEKIWDWISSEKEEAQAKDVFIKNRIFKKIETLKEALLPSLPSIEEQNGS